MRLSARPATHLDSPLTSIPAPPDLTLFNSDEARASFSESGDGESDTGAHQEEALTASHLLTLGSHRASSLISREAQETRGAAREPWGQPVSPLFPSLSSSSLAHAPTIFLGKMDQDQPHPSSPLMNPPDVNDGMDQPANLINVAAQQAIMLAKPSTQQPAIAANAFTQQISLQRY